jgi:hypothetical protein
VALHVCSALLRPKAEVIVQKRQPPRPEVAALTFLSNGAREDITNMTPRSIPSG